ncbi:MAG: 1,4-alpha-glucan branching enzyme [Cyclobacteriaceae bacterium]|jgi:1,4-alpha-glucan branching enzyme
MLRYGVVVLSFVISLVLRGQVVTSEPNFPKDDQSVVITFDATKGNAGLVGYTGDVYAHTGVITENSTSPSDWKYVKTDWGENTPETKLELIGDDLYTLTISPSIREYYGVPDSIEIQKISMVFRSADTSVEGKGDGGSDIFVDLNIGFVLQVNSPTTRFGFYKAGDMIDFSLATPETSDFSFYVDGQLISQENTSDFAVSHPVMSDQQVHELIVTAIAGEDSAGYQHNYIVDPATVTATVPEGLIDGINYTTDDTEAYLVLTAPGKLNVFVLGDFNEWKINLDFQMSQDEDKFWIRIGDLRPNQEYIFQYLIEGELLIADPYTEKVISQFDDQEIIQMNRYPGLASYPFALTEHEASVIHTAKAEYEWQVTSFEKPAKEDLVIYELLVRDFSEERTYQAVIDQLDYLDSLGINALQLMPIMEFEGNLSWGYNPAFKFAVDKFYGTEDELKLLIDECHKRGIAVILDIVLNHHFGRSPLVRMYNEGDFGKPTADNPWFNINATHDFNVGYDFNHESLYTQAYIDRVNAYWLEEYKADGYRFDLSKGFTQKVTVGNVGAWGQYDAERIALLKRMSDKIWEVDSEAYVILEHFADNSEEVELANYGMMLWGNQHGTYINSASARSSNLDWGYYKVRGWEQPNLVAYMESHDEERTFFEVGKRSTEPFGLQIQRMRMNAAFFFAIPGPKMLWQFGEFGYDLELNNDRLGIKPTRWEYLEDSLRLDLFSTYQAMINLKTQTDYLDEEYFDWQPSGDVRWITYEHPEVQTLIIGNFSKTGQDASSVFPVTGTWYNFLTGEELEVSAITQSISLDRGSFAVWTSEPIDNFTNWVPEAFLLALDQQLDLQVFPNPTSEFIHIGGLDQTVDLGYTIYDVSGRFISKGVISDGPISVSGLERGIYLLRVGDDQLANTYRVVVQ